MGEIPINIIFDGPPGPTSGHFIEVETDDGMSIKVGEWLQEGPYWKLRITKLPSLGCDKCGYYNITAENSDVACLYVGREDCKPGYKHFKSRSKEISKVIVKEASDDDG